MGSEYTHQGVIARGSSTVHDGANGRHGMTARCGAWLKSPLTLAGRVAVDCKRCKARKLKGGERGAQDYDPPFIPQGKAKATITKRAEFPREGGGDGEAG